jgi:hypothetical protein
MLIPNLPPHSVLVIDNAPFHNVQIDTPATSNAKKSTMISWLNEKVIPNTEDMHKPDLYELTKTHKPMYNTYKIDRILAEHGYSVLWLPPYHPELNLTELIWATVKKWIADRNVTFKMEDVIKLADEKLASISKDDWKLICNHVIAMEAQYITNEALLNGGQEIVVYMWSDSSESDSSSYSSKDRDDGADEHGAGLYSMCVIAPLNTDNDADQ